jgi:UDP-N-acetylmuramoyl-tripeptide--D-alanyl-D-alanine ligase
MRIELAEPARFTQLLKERYSLDTLPEIGGITIDSRQVQRGDLFIAIAGNVADGHNYIQQAMDSGAVAAMMEREVETSPDSQTLIKVANTIREIGELGRIWRELNPIPLCAITGSNGKTTTKNLALSVLTQKYKVIGTSSSYNSTIGLPLTLLQIDPEDEIAVIEMGSNQPGEIAYLCNIAKPDTALITNISATHVASLKSVEGVIHEKETLFRALSGKGTAIVNIDDPAIAKMETSAHRYTYSLEQSADVAGKYEEQESEAFLLLNPSSRIRLPLMGKHFAQNALAAVAVGLLFHVPDGDIQYGIENSPTPKGRGALLQYNGISVIDDTYNANPASVLAGLETLENLPTKGQRIAVLADMLELGHYSEAFHRQVGEFAANNKVDILYCYGPETRSTYCSAIDAGLEAYHYTNKNTLVYALKQRVSEGDSVYLKGSRAMAMETVIQEVFNS